MIMHYDFLLCSLHTITHILLMHGHSKIYYYIILIPTCGFQQPDSIVTFSSVAQPV
jgi:hypothetical protein